MTLKDKHIILGITGSIAAYKAAYIIRGLGGKKEPRYKWLSRRREKSLSLRLRYRR